jgi:hypothetical protein
MVDPGVLFRGIWYLLLLLKLLYLHSYIYYTKEKKKEGRWTASFYFLANEPRPMPPRLPWLSKSILKPC